MICTVSSDQGQQYCSVEKLGSEGFRGNLVLTEPELLPLSLILLKALTANLAA